MPHSQNPETVKIWGRRDIKATVKGSKLNDKDTHNSRSHSSPHCHRSQTHDS